MRPQPRKLYVPWVVPLQLYPDHPLSVDSLEYVCICVHRCLVFLWFVKPFYFRMTRRKKLQYLIHIQDWVKAVVFRRSKCNPAFGYVLPWSITHFMSGVSWDLHLLLWILDAVIFLAIIVHSSVPCYYNRNADRWTVMCESNIPSNSVAW